MDVFVKKKDDQDKQETATAWSNRTCSSLSKGRGGTPRRTRKNVIRDNILENINVSAFIQAENED